ncbi:MAG: polymer-forming cytoskeletal protein [Phycisphaerae bacterium]
MATRRVVCYRCNREIPVPARAMSASCPLCHQRLTIENLKITAPVPSREVMTCGDIIVDAGVKLHLTRIVASNILVRGRVIGRVAARGLLEIAPTGIIEGDVEAESVVVHDGGLIRGQFRMTPRGAVLDPPPPADAPPANDVPPAAPDPPPATPPAPGGHTAPLPAAPAILTRPRYD